MSYDPTPVPPQPPQPPKSSSSSTVIVIIVVAVAGFCFLACSGVMVALLLPAIQAAREAARRNVCMNNIKQINLALLNYQDEYGTFPPAYVADENGQPMHSWRVLILPYLEENVLYQTYDFDEPWDSPNNRKLADRMPSIFRCPSSGEEGNTTNYVAVVGDHTVWSPPKSLDFVSANDGTANTILVVETTDPDINWMEPRDLSLDEAALGIDPPGGGGISSHHAGGVLVGFCDGHVQFLDKSISPDDLRALLTADGKEPVNPDTLGY